MVDMNIFYIVLITLIVYSIISTLTYLICKENDDVIIAFGLGIFGLALCGVLRIMQAARKQFKCNIGKRSIFEEVSTGNKYKCKTKYTMDIHYWMDDYKVIKQYAKKSEWVDIPDISQEVIENSKRNCDYCKHDEACRYDVKCKHDPWGTVLEFDKFESR